MRRSGIYRIELGNGYFYIGSAINLDRREKQHRSELKCFLHPNKKMQNCWNKYKVFEFTVLEKCGIQELLLQEQVWIDKYFAEPKNVNLSPTAGSNLGVVHSSQSRANMSAAHKGIPLLDEHRAAISTALKGHTHSAETRAKLSAAHKGLVHSDESRARMLGIPKSAEHRANISAAQKGKVCSAEHCANLSVAAKKRWAKFRMKQLAMEEMDYGKKCS